MKKSLLFLLIVFTYSNQCLSQFVTIDDSIITVADVEATISNVLIDGGGSCVEIGNVSKFTGIDTNNGNPNGIGVFDAAGTDFPFQSGIILSSGNVRQAAGPNSNDQSAGNMLTWPGDFDLEALPGIPGNSFNASFIQFDFVPNINQISFNYIFLSEEYNNEFECTFADAFAFILTNQTTGEVTNLAVVPTTGEPVTPLTIRDLPNSASACNDVNPEFFGNYNLSVGGANDVDPILAATNFNGQTVVLTAESPVILGDPYTIKLVVADQGDEMFDIAVMLEAGSFNLGVNIGDDFTLSGNNAACDGSIITLDATLNTNPSSIFEWQFLNPVTAIFEDFVPAETGSTLDVALAGEYQVFVDNGTGCIAQDSVVIEFSFFGTMQIQQPTDIILCDELNDGLGLFNLDTIIPEIIGAQDPETIDVSFHLSQDDANANVGVLTATNAYESGSDQIFVRLESNNSICDFRTITFNLVLAPLPISDLTNQGGNICVDRLTGDIVSDPFLLDGTVATPVPDATYSYEWTLNGDFLSSDPIITIDQSGTYQINTSVTYSSATGPSISCEYIGEVVYTAVSKPVIEAVVLEDSFNTGGLYSVEVNIVADFGEAEYEFSVDDGPFQADTTLTGVTPGIHTVFARIVGGGCDLAETEIRIIDFPRFFTPNNDGFHDTWNILNIGEEPNLDAKIFIFDRFGKLLKQLSPTSPGWDGTFNGQPMPSSAYWFRIEFTEPGTGGVQRTFQSHFALKR